MTHTLILSFFFSGLALVVSQHHHNVHACYSCFHATDPASCTHTIPCLHGKECFSTKYEGPDHKMYYHLGCESHGACVHSENFHHNEHSWLYPYQHSHVQCGSCCSSDHCNQQTCTASDP